MNVTCESPASDIATAGGTVLGSPWARRPVKGSGWAGAAAIGDAGVVACCTAHPQTTAATAHSSSAIDPAFIIAIPIGDRRPANRERSSSPRSAWRTLFRERALLGRGDAVVLRIHFSTHRGWLRLQQIAGAKAVEAGASDLAHHEVDFLAQDVDCLLRAGETAGHRAIERRAADE